MRTGTDTVGEIQGGDGSMKTVKKTKDTRMIIVDCCFDCPHIDFAGDMGTYAFCEVTHKDIPNKYRIPATCKLKRFPL
jgi:hypothetical protein